MHRTMFKSAALALLLGGAGLAFAAEKGVDCVAPCEGDVCTYNVRVNLFASELGYFTFDECGDVTNPTIGMQIGKAYKFVQADRSNYFHPLGFAYFADGAHDDKDELEPGIVPPGSASKCDGDNSCPAPMYYENGAYLGKYSNLPIFDDGNSTIPIEISQNGELADDDFGLDHYEPKFFLPFGDWQAFGKFEIMVHFDVEDFTQDMFYFCHIHQFMTGRIKLVDENNEPINADDTPAIEYEYDEVSEFDKKCGTFNTSDYQLPNAECPDKFVCDVAGGNSGLSDFSECLDAMNCAMMAGMTSHATSEMGLFIHQMIPHHQNAVNMAKALLKTGVSCENLADDEDPACIMEVILREIINGQNAQIQNMRGVLNALDEPAYADCVVPVFGLEDIASDAEGSSSASRLSNEMTFFSFFAGLLLLSSTV